MLVCWGDKDFVFDHHFLAEFVRIFPDAEVHRFADGGHYILEDYGDEIVPHRRSRRFFDAIAHARKELWIVPGGDHRLSNVTDEMWRRLDALLGVTP